MKLALYAIGVLLLAGCASAGKPRAPLHCSGGSPVDMYVRSFHFYDVRVRDAEEVVLARVPGGGSGGPQRFQFCARTGMRPRFILDPLGGGIGYVLEGISAVMPGSTVFLTLGSELRISFVDIMSPDS